MGLQFKTIKAAATAVLVVAAAGSAGMAGMTSAVAAEPSTVALTGTLVDGAGAPLGGVHLTITEELPPDGGFSALQTVTAADGTFSADVFAWGTTAAPASLTIATPEDEELEVIGESCSRTWSISVRDARQVALSEAAPEPLQLTAETSLLGEVCGTTGTPPTGGSGNGGGNASNGGGRGTVTLTPPPTDVQWPAGTTRPDRLGPAMTIGFLVGLLAAAVLLLPRRGARRRD